MFQYFVLQNSTTQLNTFFTMVLFPLQQLCTVPLELHPAFCLLYHVMHFVQFSRVCRTTQLIFCNALCFTPTSQYILWFLKSVNGSFIRIKHTSSITSIVVHTFSQNSEILSNFPEPSSSGHRGCLRLMDWYFRTTRNNTSCRQTFHNSGSFCTTNRSPLLCKILTLESFSGQLQNYFKQMFRMI